MASNKEFQETQAHVALPLSNESAKKKRNNLLKSMVGASVIATGLVMMPQASFAQVVERPPAIVQREAVEAPSASAPEASSEKASDTKEAAPAVDETKAAAVEDTDSTTAAENDSVQGVPETEEASQGAETTAEGQEDSNAATENQSASEEAPRPKAASKEVAPASANNAEAALSEEKASEAEETAAEAAFEVKKPIPVGVADPKNVTADEIEKIKKAVVAANPAITANDITVGSDGAVTLTDPNGKKQTILAADAVIKDYSKDEEKIQDYSGKERYKTTDLQQGDTNQENLITDGGTEKDGFKFNTKNPSADSPSKTEYGYEITIDKKTGQRTYTKVYVTDSGLVPVDPKNKSMMDEGDKLTPESPDVNYKPTEDSDISASRSQRNLNYEAGEETLKHINSKDNDTTSFGMKDHYTKDNPGVKFFGESFALGYKVNPWPNENDKLEQLKLNGQYNEKVFVQGQEIDTGIKVDNIDENAKERLVGQVYNPITGKIVPGASAYIGDNGNIHIKMPEGALKKDKDGKTVINEDSIFNTPEFKALQNLDAKFFARPRTADEFTKIAETPDDFGETGKYVETGAGTADIDHDGKNITIDKQGIDRYDHYNLIGGFKLNLDDTRYYDQKFEDGNNEDTSTITSSAVKPGEKFNVKIVQSEDPKETDKSAEEMNAAQGRGEAAGVIKLDFVNKENEGKADKDKWKVDVNPSDISRFTITPPKSAKAGDFVAVPVEYTYTNGSTDVHWFHFVVQESDNNRPEYHAEVGYKGDTLTQTPEIPKDEAATKKNQPKSYELVMPDDGSKYKDSAGNEWTDIQVDPETGAVTAVVPKDADIKGGENLYVNVKVNYEDEKTGEAKEEIVKAQFIARPKYQQEVSKTFKSEIPFETKVIYDDTLEIGKVVKTEGRVGETETTFKQVVINGEKGIIDESGNFVKDKESVEVKTITEKVDAEIRIGTKPAETTVTIPPDTEYETSDSLEKGTTQLKEQGEDGIVTITTSRNPETGEITTTKVVTKEAKKKKMLIGTKTTNTIVHEEKLPFDYELVEDPSLKAGEQKVVQEGKEGNKKTTYVIENSQVVGDPKVEETAPQKAIIRVGSKKFTGETSHEVTEETKYITIVEEDPNLPVGETQEVQAGKRGSKTTKYTQKFENGVPGETKEEVVSETPAVNRIIKVGTKTVTEHISKEITEEIPYDVKIEYDDTMPAGKTKVKTKGEAGSKTTEYYRNLINGKFDGDLKTREVTEKAKDPVDEVIVVGTKVAENNKDYNNDVDVEIEYVKDDSKYLGYVEKGELTKGHVETKIVNKFDPETGEIITTEEEVVTPAKQKIIVGTKAFTGEFSHKIEKTLPFETEIQYDDTLEAGTKEVTQKGINGNAEQTVTQKYTNGVLADKEYSDKVTTKEPVKEIVKIGTKPVEKIVEIPFNTDYVYDNTIDAGTVVEDKYHLGKNGSVTVKTYFDKESGKFVSVEDEASKVAAVNKIVRIGTKPTENMCPVPEGPSTPSNPVGDKPNEPSKPGESNPSKPGEDNSNKPGEANPNKPGENDPSKPGESNPSKPSENNPSKPGESNPSTPGESNPSTPGENNPSKPGENNPSKPGGDNPSKPGENNQGKPADPNSTPSTESEGLAPSRRTNVDETIDRTKAEKAASETAKAKDDAKAPQTFDAGIAAPTGLAALASGLLVGLERLKRRKED